MFARTFHPDEANQAFTVGRLLETGHYTYTPDDHHGPTLYYAAAPLQKLFGHDTKATLDGTLLRATPLTFAVLALVLLAHAFYRLLRAGTPGAARPVAALGALMLAALLGTSPFFVFYATDFIQEMLLVSFTSGAFWALVHYFLHPAPGTRQAERLSAGTWALLFGVFAGLACATKETWVLAAAAAAAAGGLIAFRTRPRRPPARHILLAFGGFAATAVLFYSSFGQDFSGVWHAFISAPGHYLGRAAGHVAASTGADWHVHPWWQHLQWLVCGNPPQPYTRGWGWSIDPGFGNHIVLVQLLFVCAPIIVFGVLKRRSHLPRPLLCAGLFLALYTAFLTLFYSVLPYKTPWCTLQLLVPLLMTYAFSLAACVPVLCALRPSMSALDRAVGTLVFLVIMPASVIFTCHRPGLARLATSPDARDIPYNYAGAHPEVKALAACVRTTLTAAADHTPFAAIALPACDTWPLPWYLRAHARQIGYWTDFAALERLAAAGARPDVVVVPMSEGHRVQPLFPHLKNTKRFYVRPGVRARVFWTEGNTP